MVASSPLFFSSHKSIEFANVYKHVEFVPHGTFFCFVRLFKNVLKERLYFRFKSKNVVDGSVELSPLISFSNFRSSSLLSFNIIICGRLDITVAYASLRDIFKDAIKYATTIVGDRFDPFAQ